jgi:hypothetical protein
LKWNIKKKTGMENPLFDVDVPAIVAKYILEKKELLILKLLQKGIPIAWGLC